MQITQTTTEGLRREFKITVPAADIEERVRSRLTEIGRQTKMPGFRPGRVPLPILKQRYGRSVMGEILETAVSDGSRQTLSDHGLRPALEPKIEVTSFSEGSDLEFTMALEVLPEIEPVDFTSIEIDRPVAEVGDENIDKALGRLAAGHKSFAPPPEPRPAEPGDQVLITFKGSIDGIEQAAMSGEDREIELGSGRFIPGFEDQMAGHGAGEHVTVTVNFPEDYPAKDYAGKPAVFEVDIKEVRAPVPAAVDDDLAKRFGMADLATLRGFIRERMEQEYRQISRERAKRQLLDVLAERHRFEVPAGMVDLEFDQIWRQVQENLKTGDPDDPDRAKPEAELQAEYRAIAERRVRLGILLAEVGRLNHIEVTQEEMNRAVSAELQRYPDQAREIVEFYKSHPEALASMRAPILENKVVDFILEIAKVVDRPVTPEELMKDPEDRPGSAAAPADAQAADSQAADSSGAEAGGESPPA